MGSKSYSVEELNIISNGDNEFIKKMIDLFVVYGSETVEEMNNCLKTKDYANISLLAHRLKSTIKLLCISSIENEIKLLENSHKNNLNPVEVEVLVHKIRNEVYVVIKDIEVERTNN